MEALAAIIGKDGRSGSPAEILKAPVTALYFSARWCPDCRNGGDGVVTAAVAALGESIDVVLVSSEASKEAFDAQREALPGLAALPFEGDERSQSKVRYGVCAGKEAAGLGITDRKGGIPTLLILESAASGKVLSLDGMGDISTKGVEAACEGWKTAIQASREI